MTKARSNATAPNAKGTLVVGNGTDASTTLAVASTAGYLLTVDSSTATGLKWAAPAAGALTKITTATLGSATSSWDISNCFSSTYEEYLVRLRLLVYGDLQLRWLDSGGALTANYMQNRFRVANGSLTGTDVGTTQVYLISGDDADGANDNWTLGELQINRVGVNSRYIGNIASRMIGGLGGQNTFNGSRVNNSPTATTITGFRLLTTTNGNSLLANSVVTVYGLEK